MSTESKQAPQILTDNLVFVVAFSTLNQAPMEEG